MDDLNIRRLRWMADAKVGDIFPSDLFGHPNAWGPACSEMAKTLMEHLEKLQVPEGQRAEQVAEWLRGRGYTVTRNNT